MEKTQKKLETWHGGGTIVFMKLRISIVLFGAVLPLVTGCTTVKTAYNGTERSAFTNPDKIAAMRGGQTLAPVAEGPVMPEVHAANPGGIGEGSMTGLSDPETWGGALSDR
jgi:hypothetical protein